MVTCFYKKTQLNKIQFSKIVRIKEILIDMCILFVSLFLSLLPSLFYKEAASLIIVQRVHSKIKRNSSCGKY